MKIYKLIPALIIAFILQLSIVGHIAIGGVAPSLLLTFIIMTLFLFGKEVRCIAASIIVGFCLDLVVGKYLGVYALTLFLVALFTVYYKSICNNENKLSIIPLAFVGTAIYNIVPFLCYLALDVNVSILRTIQFTCESFVSNLIVMFIMYLFMIKKASYRPVRSHYERYETI